MITPVSQRTILSLCDFSGIWSEPYRKAGYNVIQVDLQHGQDVKLLKYPGPVWGILMAPDCSKFCRPGARLWKQWGEEGLKEGLSLVDACLRFRAICKPQWWALENPPGRLSKYLGSPTYKFNPCDFGDPWTKLTYLWGEFTPPCKKTSECDSRGKGWRSRSDNPVIFQRKKPALRNPARVRSSFF